HPRRGSIPLRGRDHATRGAVYAARDLGPLGTRTLAHPVACGRGGEASTGFPPEAAMPPLDDGSGRTPGGGSGTLGRVRRDERSPAHRRTRRDTRPRVAGRIAGRATGEGCSATYARR